MILKNAYHYEPHPTTPHKTAPYSTTPHHTMPHHTTTHHNTSQLTHNTTPKAQRFQKIEIMGPFIQTPKLILASQEVLRVASNQKVAKIQKLLFLGHLQVQFNRRQPNSQSLYSKPGNTTLFLDFDESTGPPGCAKYKVA